MEKTNLSEAKQAISKLVIHERGINAVGTGTDQQGRDAIVIHIDPAIPDTRERIAKLIEPIAGEVPVQFIESGPYRKFPAT